MRIAVIGGDSKKLMHVSPFFGMDQRYEWRVKEPGTTLSVHIENREHGERAFDATLPLKRRELSRRSLAEAAARYPVGTSGHPGTGTTQPKPQKMGTVPYA